MRGGSEGDEITGQWWNEMGEQTEWDRSPETSSQPGDAEISGIPGPDYFIPFRSATSVPHLSGTPC
jgi:hypothetical protein